MATRECRASIQLGSHPVCDRALQESDDRRLGGAVCRCGVRLQRATGDYDSGTVDAWIGALAYSLQLYFDFSGYSDMAIGLARMFGFRLPTNFNSPYQATSIIDFWRRWHMTLSSFFRDYVYIPLGGNRKGAALRPRSS